LSLHEESCEVLEWQAPKQTPSTLGGMLENNLSSRVVLGDITIKEQHKNTSLINIQRRDSLTNINEDKEV
jgi:hypothetical protein